MVDRVQISYKESVYQHLLACKDSTQVPFDQGQQVELAHLIENSGKKELDELKEENWRLQKCLARSRKESPVDHGHRIAYLQLQTSYDRMLEDRDRIQRRLHEMNDAMRIAFKVLDIPEIPGNSFLDMMSILYHNLMRLKQKSDCRQ